MKPEIKQRLKRTVFLAIFALIVGATLGWWQVQGERTKSGSATARNAVSSQPMTGAKIGGDFELVDHNGQTVTQENFAGKPMLLYFGFTYCPAICPTELYKVTQVLNTLGDSGDDIQPVFITIDPERDTVEIMQDYVGLFHPRMTGLTGSRAQIDDVLSAYRVYASRVDDPEMNDYTMDHSSFIYLMNEDNQLLSVYRIEDDADYIVQDVKAKLGIR